MGFWVCVLFYCCISDWILRHIKEMDSVNICQNKQDHNLMNWYKMIHSLTRFVHLWDGNISWTHAVLKLQYMFQRVKIKALLSRTLLLGDSQSGFVCSGGNMETWINAHFALTLLSDPLNTRMALQSERLAWTVFN